MLEINGVELEFDILDADIAERYEAALDAMYEEIETLDIKNMSGAEAIRKECYVIFDCFDAIFGEGAASMVFGEKTNLGTCTAALEQMIDHAAEQQKAFNERMKKYRSNRAQRREKA